MSVDNIVSVDLEDWFHICGVERYLPEKSWPQLESRVVRNTGKILACLARHHIQATFFVLGFIADRHPDLIRRIAAEGHEIALHGYRHCPVYRMTPERFRNDLLKAREAVARIIHRPLLGFRAPEWSVRDDSLWALEILQQEGFVYESSMTPLPLIGNPAYPQTPYRHRLCRGDLWEFPPLVAETRLGNLPVGGGWGLRVFPYRWIRAAIDRLNARGEPAVIYLHPGEFDPHPPRVRLPLHKRFVIAARIARTGTRLQRLLSDFRFTSVQNCLANRIDVT